MKVKIMQRSVYHKYAEVEVEVPNDVKDLQNYLVCNENLYVDKIDKAMGEANLEYGSGVHDYGGMTDTLAESEWRYESEDKNGGQL
tara:strand:+ start:691 stop:948 length:258 start_codon:yes stop_codon:yes gene_type:complete